MIGKFTLILISTSSTFSLFSFLIVKSEWWFASKLHAGLETQIYEIVPEHNGDYHMCEEIVKGFYDEGRWEEVFIKLYGDMPKYSYLRRKE